MIEVSYRCKFIREIPLTYLTTVKGERTFAVAEDIEVELSDGRKVLILKGFRTDLASVPVFLWNVFKPIDKAFIADLTHDYLWDYKLKEIKHFGGSYEARKFADDERNKWRKKLAPEKKIKNWITHRFIRLFGGFWYSKQLKLE